MNAEGVAPPLHGTRHGQIRKAWSTSSIHAMLRNRRYFGEHSWDARQYKKDAKSGKRRVAHAGHGQVAGVVVERRDDLRIVPVELEQAVAERSKMLRDRYDAANPRRRTGASFSAHSQRHLLTGLLKCGSCGARMVVHTTIKKKPSGTVYRASWFYCPVSRSKGDTSADIGRAIGRT